MKISCTCLLKLEIIGSLEEALPVIFRERGALAPRGIVRTCAASIKQTTNIKAAPQLRSCFYFYDNYFLIFGGSEPIRSQIAHIGVA